MTTKTAMIRARVQPDMKLAVEAILQKLGLTVSEAINMYFAKINNEGGIPFELKVPNKQTRKALEEVRQRKNLVKTSLAELRAKFGE